MPAPPLPTYGALPTVIDPTAWGGRTITPPNGSLSIDSIQNQIAAQLTNFFANVASPALAIPIYIWPDFDLDTWWASSAIAFVLISYRNTNLSKPVSTSAMLQERTLQFTIHVEARTVAWALSGTGSVYALIEQIEEALTGFPPVGCRNSYFTDGKFSEQGPQGEVWLYDMTYNVVTMRTKLLPQYTLAPLVQETVKIQPGGDVLVITP
jgi:hypothetical protein